ncbi:hypothetical protein [Kitasatospora purpeofusca]|uniref:hypothetical protein n=1 Tax=Kitasatospora purpeofusca TaxID=67352 RepID=UPI00386ABBD8|nr:hypothetical protein OIP63_21460 [Kitasatospora purpeofusca]
MTEQTAGSPHKLRRGTQELLERRGMATTPIMLPPRPAGTARAATGSASAAFRHGGRDSATTVPHSAPAHHAELKGHRHRGAEKHSAH